MSITKRTWKRAPAGTRSRVRGLACEVMRSMAFSLLISVSSSSMFSRMGAVMLSRSSGASNTASRAGVAWVVSSASPLHALHAARDCGRTGCRSRHRDGRSDGCGLPVLCASRGRPVRRERPCRWTAPAASGCVRATNCPAHRGGRGNLSQRGYRRRRFRASLCPRRHAGRCRKCSSPSRISLPISFNSVCAV